MKDFVIEYSPVMMVVVTLVLAYLNHRLIKNSRDQTQANVAVLFLQQYLNIMEKKSEAEKTRSKRRALIHYRELSDLMWTEFQLWKDGYVPERMMRAWLQTRSYLFHEDSGIRVKNENEQAEVVTYQKWWRELKSDFFAGPANREFKDLMDAVHSCKFDDIVCFERAMRKFRGK